MRVALIGDRHQLPAVGRGGVLDLAARYSPCVTLATVHRFTDPAYADLSLRMRRADEPLTVFDELLARGEIVVHATDVERQMALAARASLGEYVVADSRQEVSRINAVVHRFRVSIGEVSEAILTVSGEAIGVGDVVATRRNSADEGVANRETWTVVACDQAGLTVVGDAGRRDLSPEYVHQHVELGYATTAYGAQGSTVPVAHVLIGDQTGAASAYVGMTRGRDRNVAHMVADSMDDARRQWVDVFGRDRADLGPAHAALRAAEDIERYGPGASTRGVRRQPDPARRREPEPYVSPRSPGLGIGL